MIITLWTNTITFLLPYYYCFPLLKLQTSIYHLPYDILRFTYLYIMLGVTIKNTKNGFYYTKLILDLQHLI